MNVNFEIPYTKVLLRLVSCQQALVHICRKQFEEFVIIIGKINSPNETCSNINLLRNEWPIARTIMVSIKAHYVRLIK